MYVCKYVCEKYIKSISYKTTVVFRVHVRVLHITVKSQTEENQQQQIFY